MDDFRGDLAITVARKAWVEAARLLRDHPELDYKLFLDLCGVDYLDREDRDERFEVVLHLYSVSGKHHVRLKTPVPGADPKLPTITGLFRGANWFEREAWDLYWNRSLCYTVPVTEAAIVRTILRKLNALDGCYAREMHGGPYSAGLPDLFCCYHGHMYALEVKRPGGRLTALQSAEPQRWARAGATAAVVTSWADVERVLNAVATAQW